MKYDTDVLDNNPMVTGLKENCFPLLFSEGLFEGFWEIFLVCFFISCVIFSILFHKILHRYFCNYSDSQNTYKKYTMLHSP